MNFDSVHGYSGADAHGVNCVGGSTSGRNLLEPQSDPFLSLGTEASVNGNFELDNPLLLQLARLRFERSGKDDGVVSNCHAGNRPRDDGRHDYFYNSALTRSGQQQPLTVHKTASSQELRQVSSQESGQVLVDSTPATGDASTDVLATSAEGKRWVLGNHQCFATTTRNAGDRERIGATASEQVRLHLRTTIMNKQHSRGTSEAAADNRQGGGRCLIDGSAAERIQRGVECFASPDGGLRYVGVAALSDEVTKAPKSDLRVTVSYGSTFEDSCRGYERSSIRKTASVPNIDAESSAKCTAEKRHYTSPLDFSSQAHVTTIHIPPPTCLDMQAKKTTDDAIKLKKPVMLAADNYSVPTPSSIKWLSSENETLDLSTKSSAIKKTTRTESSENHKCNRGNQKITARCIVLHQQQQHSLGHIVDIRKEKCFGMRAARKNKMRSEADDCVASSTAETANSGHSRCPLDKSSLLLGSLDTASIPSSAPVSLLSAAGLFAHDARLLAHPYFGGTAGSKEGSPCASSMSTQPRQTLRHHKTVGRTQSAPLPAAAAQAPQQPPPCQTLFEHQQLVKQHVEQMAKEQHKKLITEQLRQTVLLRKGGRDITACTQGYREDYHKQEASLPVGIFGLPSCHHHRPDASGTMPPTTAPLGDFLRAPGGLGESPRFRLTPRPRAPELRHASRTRSNPLASYSGTAASATGDDEHRLRAPGGQQQLATLPSAPLCPSGAPLGAGCTTTTTNFSHEAQGARATYRTALAYDEAMLKHDCLCQDSVTTAADHIENPERVKRIWNHLRTLGLLTKCYTLRSSRASFEELLLCHSSSYVDLFGFGQKDSNILKANLVKLPCGGLGADGDTVWNGEKTAEACRLAVGSVVELTSLVALGVFSNGMAIVRPPGHHAERDRAMGFCYFNSVAIAAKYVKEKYGLQRIMILDWDVHHGNGTQQATYQDQSVLFMSLHRHDNGAFFPGSGDPEDCGEKQGIGFNVNIAFTSSDHEPMGDAEYLAAFRCLVMPIAREFRPQIVLVSCGFDAADGHPTSLGGYKLTPECFGFMTSQILSLPSCGQRVVLALEGGYDIGSTCASAEMCVRALLGEEIPQMSAAEIQRKPNAAAVLSLQKCIRIQSRFWPDVAQNYRSAEISQLEDIMLRALDKSVSAPVFNMTYVHEPCRRSTHTAGCEPMEET